MPEPPGYLLDVIVLVALLDEEHIHHRPATAWFDTPGLQWAVCAFTEAGFLRYMTKPKTGDVSMEDATVMLERLAQLAQGSGYHYQAISAGWQTLSGPF